MTQTILAVYENGVLRPLARLCALEEGQQVQLTVRPIEEPASQELARREAEFQRRLEAAGMIMHFPPPTEPPPADWTPLALEGEPLSETVIKMRREE
jgi:predicted DNA-binding antitoxin AbrB/MazE fold protein